MGVANRQFFSVQDGKLFYVGERLPHELVDEAKNVLSHHIVRKHDEHELYRSIWYVIANQRSRFEAPLRFSWALERASIDEITDLAYLAKLASSEQIGLMHTDRFESTLDYCTRYPGGIAQLANDFLADPVPVRREIVRNVTWLAHKTASLWYLSLGGTKLMTLDVHNYRQLAGIGIAVDTAYFNGTRRKDRHGRKVVESASAREYERIEREAKDLLRDEELLQAEGTCNGALLTTLFWIVGAKTTRGMSPLQHDLFGCSRLLFASPYAAPGK